MLGSNLTVDMKKMHGKCNSGATLWHVTTPVIDFQDKQVSNGRESRRVLTYLFIYLFTEVAAKHILVVINMITVSN